MEIKYIPYRQINKTKWDRCISNAANSLIYVRSFYLDAMADQWDALVLGDYEAVMPLIWRKKWAIKYLYQPAFLQQAGIFFQQEITEDEQDEFLWLTLKHFKFAEINLNFLNKAETGTGIFSVEEKNNFILDLRQSYKEIAEGYSSSFAANLKKSQKTGLIVTASDDFGSCINLYKSLYGERLQSASDKTYENFAIVCGKLQKENNLVLKMVKKDEEILACTILLKDERRLYNVASSLTKPGRDLEVNYLLFDSVIREFAEKPLLLDFEGSDIKGIADFYKSFNAHNQPYPFVKYNELPPLVKLFKR